MRRLCPAKDSGLADLPLHGFTQNQIWCAIVALACDPTAWMQMLALHDHPPGGGDPNAFADGFFRPP